MVSIVHQGAHVSLAPDYLPNSQPQAGPGAGLGLFATAAVSAQRHGASWWSWLWPRRGGAAGQREPTTLAAFPLAAAITARKACQDPQLGEQFRWGLRLGLGRGLKMMWQSRAREGWAGDAVNALDAMAATPVSAAGREWGARHERPIGG